MKKICTLLALIGFGQAHAGLITNVYEVSIDRACYMDIKASRQSSNSTTHNCPITSGKFNIYATVDDESFFVGLYDDGLNQVAEQGDGDDTVVITSNAVIPGYNFSANADLVLDEWFSVAESLFANYARADEFKANSKAHYNENMSILDSRENGKHSAYYLADGWNMSISTGSTNLPAFYSSFNTPDLEAGSDELLVFRGDVQLVDSFAVDSVSVPEPTILPLFALFGILVFARKRT